MNIRKQSCGSSTARSRAKVDLACKTCGLVMHVRRDYINKHKGKCHSCSKKYQWTQPDYREKTTASHIGYQVVEPLPYGESNFNSLFGSYIHSSELRDIDFLLTVEQFRFLTKQNCFYCGVEPLQKRGSEKVFKYGFWTYNGIDRLDSKIGYVIDNCVACCSKCNYMKQELGFSEFIGHMKKIIQHIEKDTIGSRQMTAK